MRMLKQRNRDKKKATTAQKKEKKGNRNEYSTDSNNENKEKTTKTTLMKVTKTPSITTNKSSIDPGCFSRTMSPQSLPVSLWRHRLVTATGVCGQVRLRWSAPSVMA